MNFLTGLGFAAAGAGQGIGAGMVANATDEMKRQNDIDLANLKDSLERGRMDYAYNQLGGSAMQAAEIGARGAATGAANAQADHLSAQTADIPAAAEDRRAGRDSQARLADAAESRQRALEAHYISMEGKQGADADRRELSEQRMATAKALDNTRDLLKLAQSAASDPMKSEQERADAAKNATQLMKMAISYQRKLDAAGLPDVESSVPEKPFDVNNFTKGGAATTSSPATTSAAPTAGTSNISDKDIAVILSKKSIAQLMQMSNNDHPGVRQAATDELARRNIRFDDPSAPVTTGGPNYITPNF